MSAPEELAAFCGREWPRLVGTLSLYCADPGLAEELAQETLERVCRRWGRIAEADAPAAYVHRMAINLANSRFRRAGAARRATQRLGSDDAHQDRDVAGDVALRDAVGRLPTRQKAALVLRFYADLNPTEVGEHLDCSAQAVRNLTHRAIATLREELGEDIPLSLSQEAADAS